MRHLCSDMLWHPTDTAVLRLSIKLLFPAHPVGCSVTNFGSEIVSLQNRGCTFYYYNFQRHKALHSQISFPPLVKDSFGSFHTVQSSKMTNIDLKESQATRPKTCFPVKPSPGPPCFMFLTVLCFVPLKPCPCSKTDKAHSQTITFFLAPVVFTSHQIVI